MVLLLFASILIVILNILIIGILFSKVKLNIEDLVIYSNLKSGKILLKIDLYLFRKFKLISISFYNEYLKIACIKIYYKKILKYKTQIIDNGITLSKLIIGKNRLSLNLLKPEIEVFYMNLIISTKNAATTSITSSLISSTTSMILSKYMKEYNERKIYFKVVPVFYNVNGFNLKIKTTVSFETFYILLFIYDYLWLKNNN